MSKQRVPPGRQSTVNFDASPTWSTIHRECRSKESYLVDNPPWISTLVLPGRQSTVNVEAKSPTWSTIHCECRSKESYLVDNPLWMSKQRVLREWSCLSFHRCRGLKVVEQILVGGVWWVVEELDHNFAEMNLWHHHLHERLIALARIHQDVLRKCWQTDAHTTHAHLL